MTAMTKETLESKSQIKILPGLEGVEKYLDMDDFKYLLRQLFEIVSRSGRLKESKEQLQRRIALFEKQSGLPGFLTAAPIERLLEQLEDAQYFYSIYRRERVFPTFH